MKLLELTIENVAGVSDGAYAFANASGVARDVVVLEGGVTGVFLETIAALLERFRSHVCAPHHRHWWAQRRGALDARVRARWALSELEAARVWTPEPTFASEWRLGRQDEVPRELWAGEAPSARERVELARYAYLDANRSAVWVGEPAADPLGEVLTKIVRRDIAATRALCRRGVGLVATKTPDTLADLNRAIVPILPTLRLERVACGRGGRPVACFRGEQQVELDQLAAAEREAIYIAAALQVANVREGMILLTRAELHPPPAERLRWLDWLTCVTASNQLFVTSSASEMTCATEPRRAPRCHTPADG